MSEQKQFRPASSTAMKPETAAKKLGIYLPATPEEFQKNALTHAEFREIHNNPPEWLQELRRTGPHPRQVVAQKLGVSIAALKRNNADQPLTTAEIEELRTQAPEWLSKEREVHAQELQEKSGKVAPKSTDSEATASEA